MIKRLFSLLAVLWSLLPGEVLASAEPITPEAVKVYTATLEMRVQIYRISRDKIYEIFYPEFELIRHDLADAVDILEAQVKILEKNAKKRPYLNEAVNLWNNLRFHAMRKLDKKEFVRFYYDTQTVDNLLQITLDKLEEEFGLTEKKWVELRKRYGLQASVFRLNTGYMTKKYGFPKSVQHILDKEIPQIEENTFVYAKRQGYFSDSPMADLLVIIMNDWVFLKYNFHNVLFGADRTIFAVTNSMYKRIELIINMFAHEI
ncbi:MAG: hypothetical protein GXO27_06095 [Chlorobi bacterium]|nr:hypothetical protein [Chlorobiota bacterium]